MGQLTADAEGSGYSENLLVWSWRRIVSGKLHCPVMAREFADTCGKSGGDVFRALCGFVQTLGYASRRRLRFSYAPGPLGMSADERQVLTLIAAAQTDEHALLQAHLLWLSLPERREELRFAARTLAALLKANNLLLDLPASAVPTGSEPPRALG